MGNSIGRIDGLLAAIESEMGSYKKEILKPTNAGAQHAAISAYCNGARGIAELFGQVKYDIGTWRNNLFGNSDDGIDSVGEDMETVLIQIDRLAKHKKTSDDDDDNTLGEFVVVE